jgi:transcriptional regulator with XRE-family HTH domain
MVIDRLQPLIQERSVTGEPPVRLTSIADIAAAVRGRRMDLGLSQGDLAERAGVSRRWVNQFEGGGRTTAEVGAILAVLDALGLDLQVEAVSGATDDSEPATGGVNLDVLLDDLRRG